jgi:hypothetical protein
MQKCEETKLHCQIKGAKEAEENSTEKEFTKLKEIC